MKKIFILMTACIALVFSLSGCSSQQTFTAREESFDAAGISSVVIDVEDREVSVGVSDDGKIHIDCFESEKEFYEIRSEEGVLTMSLVYDKEWTDFIGVKPSDEVRKISVAVPDQMLSDLKVVTTNEKICLDTLSFTGSVSLDSNGGDVSFETLSVGVAVGLTAKDGNISGTLAGGWDDFSISCETKKGECNLPESKPGGAKSLTVQCNNGDVNIAFRFD